MERQCALAPEQAGMRNLIGKIALTTGSALVAGALLVIAYLAAGYYTKGERERKSFF